MLKKCVALYLFFVLGVAQSDVVEKINELQTNVAQAKHQVDVKGIPLLNIGGVGVVNHPAWTALYALAYAGVEFYEPMLGLKKDEAKFTASIEWLKNNLVINKQGQWVWIYHFDNTYNDVNIKAPWSSAFAQAVGIQALLASWKQDGDKQSLALAEKAAESLFVPPEKGGFLFSSGKDVWFEEIPSPSDNPSHILNGHMRALLALGELGAVTGEEKYKRWFEKGAESLLKWLPLFDTGYWFRYDLNPRKNELLYRFANPYGFANPALAIDRIVLRDPLSGMESVLDVGSENDAEGPLRIAGNDWGARESIDGRSVRRLKPVQVARDMTGRGGGMLAPHSYFYLSLPGEWKDNLRSKRFELSIEYFDEAPANLEVQTRAISSGGDNFKPLRDGDLLISGGKEWRKWNVEINPRDLGYWVGELYAKKHFDYLSTLSKMDRRFLPWENSAKFYLENIRDGADYNTVNPKKKVLPRQTPMLPLLSFDKDGVLMQHLPSTESKFDQTGLYDFSSDKGSPVYSPYIIATQVVDGNNPAWASALIQKNVKIRRLPALNWLTNKKNQQWNGDAVLYAFPFVNVYNDVETKAPWPSAFSQAYILKAFDYARRNLGDSEQLRKISKSAALAYFVSVDKGGISALNKNGFRFFEEVPNSTHVLNAHIASINALSDTANHLNDATVRELANQGVDAIRNELYLFDSGYWLRYDLNPRKNLLFQIDWVNGEKSPLVESISLEAPQFSKKVKLLMGGDKAFDGESRIAGLEWSPVQSVDGNLGRSFSNGYALRRDAVKGGTRHNVYAFMQLPIADFVDYFEVKSHRLVIRYKDVAPGQFLIKLQAVNEGNFLDFVPLRNALLTTIGDQKWKSAVVEVRPQDMGWFKGKDYQSYETTQLELIAKLTGDWFFSQYAQRQKYFLNMKENGKTVIFEPVSLDQVKEIKLSVVNSSKTYPGFGFDNSIDGNPDNNYVAGLENERLAYVDLKLEESAQPRELRILWESGSNYSRHVKVYAWRDAGEEPKIIGETNNASGIVSIIKLEPQDKIDYIRVEFSGFYGQSRVLLREMEFH